MCSSDLIILFKHNDYYYIFSDKELIYFHFNSNELIKVLLINNKYIDLKLCEKFNSIGYEKINDNNVKQNINNDDDDDNKITEIVYTDRLNGFDSETETDKEIIENDEINHNMSLIELQKKAKELKIETFYFVGEVRKMKNKKELCTEIISHKNIK